MTIFFLSHDDYMLLKTLHTITCNFVACPFYPFYIYIYKYVDVVEWSRALDVRLSEWCCSVTMVWVQIPSREEQKFDSSKI